MQEKKKKGEKKKRGGLNRKGKKKREESFTLVPFPLFACHGGKKKKEKDGGLRDVLYFSS